MAAAGRSGGLSGLSSPPGLSSPRGVAAAAAATSDSAAGRRTTGQEQVYVWHLLFPPGTAAEEIDRVEAQLRAERVDYEEAAKEHSACPSRERGGTIGWISRGQMHQALEDVAFSAELGEYARVETKAGTHLVSVWDQRDEPVLVEQITACELHHLMHSYSNVSDTQLQLMDVRERGEHAKSALPMFELYPLSEFHLWSHDIEDDLDAEKPTIVLCHHGMRSNQVAHFLASQGFAQVMNVEGGIHAYSAIDPEIPTY